MDTQGMLLTSRPPDSMMSNMGNDGSDPPQISIGNYKGVMLCNRPFAGVLAASKHSASSPNKLKRNGSSTRDSLICGTVSKPWGSNVVIPEKSRVLSRISKKDGALSKHKKWLSDLQKKKERLEQERLEEEEAKEDKKRKFKESQAKKRAMAWHGNEELNTTYESDETEENAPDLVGPEDNKTPKKENDMSRKPAWAMTESTAKEVEELAEVKEEEDLLTFVDELDFETYTDDLELKVLMDQVKERIRTLQKEKNIDEAKLKAALESEVAAMRPDGTVTEENLKIVSGTSFDENDSDDELKSVADSIRSNASVRSIHSQKSIEALVAKAKERMETMEPIIEGEIVMKPPVLITHTDDDGARLAETKSLNKLPFKNRNPAV